MPNTESYRQVVDNEGNTTFERIESLPDEVIYQDKRYRDVVDESVSRRNKIKEQSTELERLVALSAQSPAEPAPVTPVTVVPNPVKVPTFDEFYAQWEQRQATNIAQQTQRQQELSTLLTEHGLDASYLPILEDARDPKKTAETLGRKVLSFAQGGVNPDATPDPNTIFGRINKELGLK